MSAKCCQKQSLLTLMAETEQDNLVSAVNLPSDCPHMQILLDFCYQSDIAHQQALLSDPVCRYFS